MTVNKRELRAAVRLRNGITDIGEGLAAHTDIDDCVGAALRDVCAEKRWPWLLTSSALTFSTVTGQPAAMPAGWAQIHKLVVNGVKATHVPLDEFVSGDRRFVWTEIGSTIQLDPVPAVAPTATLWYWQDEPALVTDDQSPLLPTAFHQTLVARASYHLNLRRDMNAAVARDLVDWQAGLKNLMSAAARTIGPRTIRSAYRDTPVAARW